MRGGTYLHFTFYGQIVQSSCIRGRDQEDDEGGEEDGDVEGLDDGCEACPSGVDGEVPFLG